MKYAGDDGIWCGRVPCWLGRTSQALCAALRSASALACRKPEAGEATEAREKARADLLWLFDRNEVPGGVQDHMIFHGIKSVKVFSQIASSPVELKELLKTEFGLEATHMEKRVTLAAILVSWEAARCRAAKVAEQEAEAELMRKPKIIPSGDFAAMRRALEEIEGKLEDQHCPALAYIEMLSKRIERGEYRPESLEEVVDVTQDEPDELNPVWDPAKGTMKAVRPAPRRPLPKDTEELRERIELMGAGWIMLAKTMPNAACLQGLTMKFFTEYARLCWEIRS